MIDWPILASNIFIATAIVLLVAAPLVGAAGGWRAMPRSILAGLAITAIASCALLAFAWRAIPSGVTAAALGHFSLLISVVTLAEIGRACRRLFEDPLAAAMAALAAGVTLVGGIFALAPLTDDLSQPVSRALLVANPLVAAASAANIDFFHLEAIYRTSPFAHRGVALPAWTTTVVVYAAAGLAMNGASRIRHRSHSS